MFLFSLISPQTQEIIRALQESNESYAAIAARYKITRQRIYQIKELAVKEGLLVPDRPLGRPRKDRVQQRFEVKQIELKPKPKRKLKKKMKKRS